MEIDYVDTYDSSLLTSEVRDIRAAGREPVTLTATIPDAITRIVDAIIRRAGRPGVITVLRFHGHGEPGAIGVNSGNENFDQYGNGIAVSNFSRIANTLARLRPYFAPNARVDLMGCQTGSGPSGHRLLRELAHIWGVPVSAGSRTQFGGGASTFQFEGPVYTARPNGHLHRTPGHR